MVHEVLHEEVKSLGLKVSQDKTKVQSSHDLLDDTGQSVQMCAEHIEINKSCTYLVV